MVKLIAFGFGAAVGLAWLYWLGDRAIAREQTDYLLHRLLRERRDEKWRAMR